MNQLLCEKLISLISQQIGFHIKPKDYATLEDIIQKRIKILNLSNSWDYYNLLRHIIDSKSGDISLQQKYKAEKEWQTLATIITNGESFFFRDRGQFNLLEKTIIPQLIASKRQAYKNKQALALSLKIWSSGCSMGQEPYSLAILLHKIIPDISQWNITIIGTDINQDFLDKAKIGIYQDWSFRLSDSSLKKDYFTTTKKGWQINTHIQKMVTFWQDNIVQDKILPAPCYGIDLIICRNVFIYFEKHSITKGVNKFYSALNPEGYFMTGHAELQGVSLKGFKTLSFPESIIYQRLAKGTRDDFLPLPQNNLNYQSVGISLQENNPLQSAIAYPQNILNKNYPDSPTCSSQKTQIQTTSPSSNNNSDDRILLRDLEKLLAAGKYNQVIAQAQQIIQQQSNEHLIYQIMAQAHTNQGNIEQAEQYCQQVLKIDSIFVPSIYLLAQIAKSQNNLKKAKELLKRIIYLEPSSVIAYLELASVYTSEADSNRASKMYRTAHEILQDFPSDKTFDYQGTVTVSQLRSHIEDKLSGFSECDRL
ncbi:MAG: CheR family methyltransferase [Xenococcaceae cyanobacterium MO_207.B15]|nr:CheR family methyltransferase [Xenococcaceae cyanobacterium MO_207.B15]